MYEQSVLERRNQSLFFFRHAPPLLERNPPEDAFIGERPEHPVTGVEGWKRSIFYYWWRFVREIPGLREEIEAGQPYPVGSIHQDFSRAFDSNFRDWWVIEGRYLFCEPRTSGISLEKPPLPVDGYDDRIVFSIPLQGDLEQVMAEMKQLLKPAMSKFKAEQGPSRARYPVFGKPVLSSLYMHYTVWRARRDNPGLKLYQIADIAGVMASLGENDAHTKSVKSASVSRFLRQAEIIIEFAAQGIFPVMNENQREQAQTLANDLVKRRRIRDMQTMIVGRPR